MNRRAYYCTVEPRYDIHPRDLAKSDVDSEVTLLPMLTWLTSNSFYYGNNLEMSLGDHNSEVARWP